MPGASTEYTLPPGAEETYSRIIDKQPVPDDAPGLRKLQELRLIAPHPVKPGRYTALDAQLAIRSHMASEQEALHRTAQRMAGLAALDRLAARHDQARYWSGPPSEFLLTADLVSLRIAEAVSRATTEVLTAQPTPRKQAVIDSVMERDTGLLMRGVRMKILYHASTRANPHVKDYVREVQAYGAELRVLHGPFSQLICIDGREAFIRNMAGADAADHSGWYVRDAAAVAYMREAYLLDWTRAEPWTPGEQRMTGWLTERQKVILQLLADGQEQEMIARRLDVSPRTVAKHLAAIRAHLGMRTTAQLMVWYGQTLGEES
ncbi:LuxR C-terminal-related transcriptional regulator [Streptomyces sp. NPDC058757]|uniref:LuxR C-terminal-related transcriptional regulator n=1 Tax=Streptomyces sp. NPDC058757 TaxID=3346626 RepID=UPI0036CEFCDF